MVRFDYVVMTTASATDLQDYSSRDLADHVDAILDAVRRRGDDALLDCAPARQARRVALDAAEIERCIAWVPPATLADLRLVQERARRFAAAQRAAVADFETDGLPGTRAGVRHVAIGSVGICLPAAWPGGPALSCAQAGVIAAVTAGVQRVAVCLGEPDSDAATLLVAAVALAGATEIYGVGGVRGFAALQFGTESIQRTERVFGVGDAELEEAQRRVLAAGAGSIGRGIVIIADDHADPELIAADLIAAGESGPRTRAVLIATSPAVAARAASAITRQLQTLSHGARAQAAWRHRGAIHVVDDREAACALADHHAPQRVEVMTMEPRWFLERLQRCGELFLGPGAGIALSEDMLARPRAVSRVGELEPLWVGSFLHTVTYRETEACEPSASAALARHHRIAGLEAHARACELRAARDGGGSREG